MYHVRQIETPTKRAAAEPQLRALNQTNMLSFREGTGKPAVGWERKLDSRNGVLEYS